MPKSVHAQKNNFTVLKICVNIVACQVEEYGAAAEAAARVVHAHASPPKNASPEMMRITTGTAVCVYQHVPDACYICMVCIYHVPGKKLYVELIVYRVVVRLLKPAKTSVMIYIIPRV